MPLYPPRTVPQTTDVTATITDVTTTSTVDVLVPGMTRTPAAGIYLVRFSAIVGGTVNGQNVTVSIYVGGVQVANSERTFRQQDTGLLALAAAFRVGIGSHREVTVNGSQAVEIRWRNAGGGVASLDGSRAMTLFRVG